MLIWRMTLGEQPLPSLLDVQLGTVRVVCSSLLAAPVHVDSQQVQQFRLVPLSLSCCTSDQQRKSSTVRNHALSLNRAVTSNYVHGTLKFFELCAA